jgi:hypothetical protein
MEEVKRRRRRKFKVNEEVDVRPASCSCIKAAAEAAAQRMLCREVGCRVICPSLTYTAAGGGHGGSLRALLGALIYI